MSAPRSPSPEELARIEAAITAAVRSAPHEAQAKVIDLIGHAFDEGSLEFDRGMASALIEGTFVVTGLNDQGELLFKLTDKGHDQALNALHNSKKMRQWWRQLGGVISEPPKGKQ